MKQKEPTDDKFACFVGNLNLSGLTGTKIILWLAAIAIASFAIGSAILAVSGDLPGSAGNKASPFSHTAMIAPHTTTIPLDGATAGNVRITMSAGELTLRGGAPQAALLDATVFSTAPEWQPEISWSANGTDKSVTISDREHTREELFAAHSPGCWEILLTNKVPVRLQVDVGAGDSTLDLSDLNLAALDVNNGVGDAEIDLGRFSGDPFRANIHHGVGDLTLRVPGNSNTRIAVKAGVGDVINNGLEPHEDYFTTKGYNPSLPVNEIVISQGVGSITLKTT